MHLEFLAEEASLGLVLETILPKMLPPEITFKIHDFRGKENLLKNLLNRLKAYKKMIDNGYNCKIVVLIDEDREDCLVLKKRLAVKIIFNKVILKLMIVVLLLEK